MSSRDFNNLRQWLLPKIQEAGYTIEQFSQHVNISKQQLYRYFYDRSRPTSQTMARICRVLGVPLEEGLRQYTPPTIGRPRGSGGTSREVRVRQR